MEKINKSIIVNVVVDYTVYGEVRKNLRASGYVEDGHEFYLVDEFMESDMRDLSPVFRADGKPVYDFVKMVEILQNAGIDRMDAEDYISDNYYGLYGDDTPIIMRSIEDM